MSAIKMRVCTPAVLVCVRAMPSGYSRNLLSFILELNKVSGLYTHTNKHKIFDSTWKCKRKVEFVLHKSFHLRKSAFFPLRFLCQSLFTWYESIRLLKSVFCSHFSRCCYQCQQALGEKKINKHFQQLKH